MTVQEIQNAQMLGRNYANDNFNHIYVPGMTHDEFAKEALENYNNNADAFNEPCLQEEYEKDFLFGAKQSMRFDPNNENHKNPA